MHAAVPAPSASSDTATAVSTQAAVPVVVPVASAPIASGAPPAPPRKRPAWHCLAPIAVLVVAAGVAVVLVFGGEDKPSYAQQAATTTAALSAANNTFTDQAERLEPSSPARQVEDIADANLVALQDARRRTATAAAGAVPDPSLTADLIAAFDAQERYLDALMHAADSPKSADPPTVGRAADRVSASYAALDGRVTGLAAPQGAAELEAWMTARQATARRRASVGAFVRRVDAVLEQSREGRRKITEVAQQIRDFNITVADARAKISEVIANREAVLASTLALPGDTASMSDIKRRLAEAFRRSLDNDRDFQDGVAAYESGDFGRYVSKVFDDSFASSGAARTAKGAFLDAYNKLRAKRGLPAVPDDF